MSEYIYTETNMPESTCEMMRRFYRREEIVRCRDCKYGHEVYWPTSSGIPSDYLDCTGALVETWDYYNDDFKDNPVEPNGFCKWGERREQ